MKHLTIQMLAMLALCASANAQINAGSNGSDGALDFSSINYTTNIIIDMHDHPNGIYQYTYVNIPSPVTVTFIPNANNTPVTWLVQSNVVISGSVDVSATPVPVSGPWYAPGAQQGGPGGYIGGYGGTIANSGAGPGGGRFGSLGGNASFATVGGIYTNGSFIQASSGSSYGNIFLLPLLGGSGGGGSTGGIYGGGGGGAILIATSETITLNGSLVANGANGEDVEFDENNQIRYGSGAGSGGSIRLVASRLVGNGIISANGGIIASTSYYVGSFEVLNAAGTGRIRIDVLESDFNGTIGSAFTQGSQFIVIPSSGQLPQLTVTSVGGVPVSASPTGVLTTPDAVLSAQQNNPILVVVSCANLPLNSLITVSVAPANGSPISATGYNNTGTQSSSTATISITIPRGGGIVYATAATSN